VPSAKGASRIGDPRRNACPGHCWTFRSGRIWQRVEARKPRQTTAPFRRGRPADRRSSTRPAPEYPSTCSASRCRSWSASSGNTTARSTSRPKPSAGATVTVRAATRQPVEVHSVWLDAEDVSGANRKPRLSNLPSLALEAQARQPALDHPGWVRARSRSGSVRRGHARRRRPHRPFVVVAEQPASAV
jgi:hypothetical protein